MIFKKVLSFGCNMVTGLLVGIACGDAGYGSVHSILVILGVIFSWEWSLLLNPARLEILNGLSKNLHAEKSDESRS